MAGGVCSFPFPCARHRHHCLLVGVDDDETMTEAEIDAEFERTQPIGNAINALYRAELALTEALQGLAGPEDTP